MPGRPDPESRNERLSQAILHAILSSQEVQAQIADLQSRGRLDAEDVLALALRFPATGGLEARVELIRKGTSESDEVEPVEAETSTGEEETGQPPAILPKPQAPRTHRKMTPNELAFENYLQERFDEKAWMKEVGIRFLQDWEEVPLHRKEAQKKEDG